MKTTLTVLLAALLSNFQLLLAQENNRIFWTDSVQLSWADFQAEAKEGQTIAALSSIAIPFSFETDGEGEISIQIQVCFVKNESWVKKAEQTPLLLKHEQIHFDIAELHRRKIVKALKEANFTKSNYKEKLENIVGEHWNKIYRNSQDQYDQETNFSQYIKAQLEWSKKLKRLLEEYKDYREENFTVSLINFEED